MTERLPLVLCYHAVSAVWPSTLAMPPALLERQLSTLARRGYVGLTFADSERRRAAGTLPARSVVITFDDAFASVELARPILEHLGFPATVFVVGAFAAGEPLRWPEIDRWAGSRYAAELASLDWNRLRALRDAGWEIGSHTLSHPSLPSLDDPALVRELRDSKALIERELGGCETLAYPFGHNDERVARAASEAGYLAACTLSGSHLVDEPMRRPRVGLYPRDEGLRLAAKLSPLALRARRAPLVGLVERRVRGRRAPGRSGALV